MVEDRPQSLTERLRAFWSERTTQQRTAILGSVALILGCIVLASFLRKPAMAPLYADLEQEDMNQIVTQLEATRTPYQIQGNLVLVPRDRVYSLRAQLAEAGLPVGQVKGWELFDGQDLGQTDQQFRVKRQRAAQGEIVRMIRGIRGITDAKVAVVFPEDKLFKEEQEPPTAAVQVGYVGATLPQSKVDALALLVSHAVEGLDPKNIAITDTRGNTYRATSAEEGAFRTSEAAEREQHRRDRVAELEKKIQEALDLALGRGRSTAKVNIELSWDKQTQDDVNYSNDEDSGKPYEKTRSTEDQTYKGLWPRGYEPGVARNVPPATPESPLAPAPGAAGAAATPPATAGPTYPETGAGSADYTISKAHNEYVHDEKRTHREQSPPVVTRITVGVLIDEGEVDAATAQGLEQAIQQVAGLDPNRGDQITVRRVPFTAVTAKAPPGPGLLQALGAWLIPVLVALMGLGSVVVTHRACNPPPVPVEEIAEEEEEVGPTLEQLIAEHLPTEEELAQERRNQRTQDNFEVITAEARQDPEGFANLLRTWLTQE